MIVPFELIPVVKLNTSRKPNTIFFDEWRFAFIVNRDSKMYNELLYALGGGIRQANRHICLAIHRGVRDERITLDNNSKIKSLV